MKELLRSNDIVFLSFADALLRGEGIDSVLLDTYASAVDGSISAIQRRLMVADADLVAARALIVAAGEGRRLV